MYPPPIAARPGNGRGTEEESWALVHEECSTRRAEWSVWVHAACQTLVQAWDVLRHALCREGPWPPTLS